MVMFREFKVEDLFESHTVSKKLTKAAFSLDGCVPVYSSDTRNNGVLGYTEQNPTFIVDTIQPTYVIFGDHTRTINIVHESFCVMDNVKVLSPKLNLSDEALLYIKAVWLKGIPILGYARHWRVAKDIALSLPVKPNTDEINYTEDDIDWDYMESYIHELEESYIHELDAYLKETGLDDYVLTDDEQALLESEPMFKEFKIGDLFKTKGRGTRITKRHREPGSIPLVTAGKENQGIAEFIQENKELFEGPVFTIDMFGNSFARDYDFYADDNIIVFKRDGLSITQYLYVVSTLGYLSQIYGYGNQFRLNSIDDTTITLPVKPCTDEINYTEDDIDWDYMESYIHAMEKQVIADVVDYKDSMITTAKEFIYV